MTKSKKYGYQIEQKDAVWTAQITRKASYKKTIISKEQTGFATEAEAKEWAEQQLVEFTSTLSSSNKRHGQQRKKSEEGRLQRSARRAEKTKREKQAKADEATLAESAEGATEEE